MCKWYDVKNTYQNIGKILRSAYLCLTFYHNVSSISKSNERFFCIPAFVVVFVTVILMELIIFIQQKLQENKCKLTKKGLFLIVQLIYVVCQTHFVLKTHKVSSKCTWILHSRKCRKCCFLGRYRTVFHTGSFWCCSCYCNNNLYGIFINSSRLFA